MDDTKDAFPNKESEIRYWRERAVKAEEREVALMVQLSGLKDTLEREKVGLILAKRSFEETPSNQPGA